MSNLGTIATWYDEAPGCPGFYYNQGNLLAIRLGGIEVTPDLLAYMDQDTTDGHNATPCSRLKAGPMYIRFRWAVAAGTPNITIWVKQVENLSPRPTMVIEKNASIGVSSDITLTAGSSAGWVQLGPQSVSISSPGGLWVRLCNNLPGWRACKWDDLVTNP